MRTEVGAEPEPVPDPRSHRAPRDCALWLAGRPSRLIASRSREWRFGRSLSGCASGGRPLLICGLALSEGEVGELAVVAAAWSRSWTSLSNWTRPVLRGTWESSELTNVRIASMSGAVWRGRVEFGKVAEVVALKIAG